MNFTLIEHLSTPVVYLTQSLWRDEAFSFFLAKNPISSLLKFATSDFNPPLYYIVLHFWMRIFGESEMAMRSLSFIFQLLTSYVGFKLGSLILGRKLGRFVFLLILFNPILLYYGFEARMYSMLAFFSIASVYFFFEKKWQYWFIFTFLGMYSQLFFWFTILAEGVFVLLISRDQIVSFFKRVAFLLILYIPWMPVIFTQVIKGTQGFWVNKIDHWTVMSSLGNIFTSYEGTPGGLWGKTSFLSLFIAILIIAVWIRRRDEFVKFITIWLFLPLATVLLISLWKPIFVNRYLIFLSIPMTLFIVAFGKLFIRRRDLILSIALLFECSVFFYFGPYFKKIDIRGAVGKIRTEMAPGDVLVSRTPLTFFEANYYFNSNAYLYGERKNVPHYVGRVLIPEEKMVQNLNKFPKKVFILNDNGSYEVLNKI